MTTAKEGAQISVEDDQRTGISPSVIDPVVICEYHQIEESRSPNASLIVG